MTSPPMPRHEPWLMRTEGRHSLVDQDDERTLPVPEFSDNIRAAPGSHIRAEMEFCRHV